MSDRALLLTEQLVATPRLATALLLSGAYADPAAAVVASFVPGRPPAAAIAGRLQLVHRALDASDAPSTEAALLGACEAISARRVIMWNSARAVSALHALRMLDERPHVTCILPLEDASPWDEAAVTAGRAANLIDRFVIEDPATRPRLLEAGVEPTCIELAPLADARVAAGGSKRALVIGDRQADGAWAARPTGIRAATSAVVAAALGWCPRAGDLNVVGIVDGAAAFGSAARNGWQVHSHHPAIEAALRRAT